MITETDHRKTNTKYDFIYMQILNNNINEETKHKQTHRYRLMVDRGRGFGGLSEKGEGIKKYKLVVTK